MKQLDNSSSVPHNMKTPHPALSLASSTNRKCLLNFLTGHLSLRIHAGRIKDPVLHRPISRERRTCRLGCDALEDEIHLLFQCNGTYDYIRARTRFQNSLQVEFPYLAQWPLPVEIESGNPALLDTISLWASHEDACKVFAKFVKIMLDILRSLL